MNGPVRTSASMVLLGLSLMVLTATLACARSADIQDILINCEPKRFEHVNVPGKVLDTLSLPVADLYGYKLGDDNATIWVLARYSNPPEGAEITLQASAYPVRYLKDVCERREGDALECGLYAQALKFVAGECLLIEEKRK